MAAGISPDDRTRLPHDEHDDEVELRREVKLPSTLSSPSPLPEETAKEVWAPETDERLDKLIDLVSDLIKELKETNKAIKNLTRSSSIK